MLRSAIDYEEASLIDPYWKNRWQLYLKSVAKLCVKLDNQFGVKKILEIGANKFPMYTEADTLDIIGNPTYKVNLGKELIPVKDKSYDLVIATQVWEHLDGNQVAAFREVQRVSKMVILSFPYLWPGPFGKTNHSGIKKDKCSEWTDYEPYSIEKIVGENRKRLIRVWIF